MKVTFRSKLDRTVEKGRILPSQLNSTQRKKIASLQRELAAAKLALANVMIVAADRIAPHKKLWQEIRRLTK